MEYVQLGEVKEFLKSKRYNQKTGNGYVLALSPTVIDELDTLQIIDLSIIDEMIEIEIEGESIKVERLRCLEDVLGRLKGIPPSRHNIS